MKKIVILLTIAGIGGFFMFGFLKKAAGDEKIGLISPHLNELDTNSIDWKSKTNEYWKKVLTPVQYNVTREEGTERAFTGQFWNYKNKGTYSCSNCGQELFSSETKYDSGTGWPSFFQPVSPKAVGEKKDSKFGMTRVEVHCSRCGAHLGHVFEDGPQPTGLRYCMNSVSLNFISSEKKEK